ncbi:MAG: hypothetical protein U0O04_06875 [Clostridia bacterium]
MFLGVEKIGGDVFFEIEPGRSTFVKIVKELYRVKLKDRPEGFQHDVLDDVEKIDKELGFIDEHGYRDKENYNVEAANEQSSFESRLQRVLDDRGEYVSSVIGNKLKNVELHKYYKYLMKTAFRGKKIDIKPIDKNYLEGIQYVLIARQSDECPEDICYLYDKEQGKFVKTSMEDILEKKKREEQKEKSGEEGIELDID